MLRVRALNRSPTDEVRWSTYVEAAPTATIYHDLAWRIILERNFGYRSTYLLAEDDRGTIQGVLPLFHVPSLLGAPRLVSVPFRDRGGVLFNNEAACIALIREAETLKKRAGASQVELKTIAPYPDAVIEQTNILRRDHWIRSKVALGELTETKLAKSIGNKIRLVRQAERARLIFADLTDDASALDHWYRVHQASQRRLGVPPFAKAFFSDLLSSLAPAKKAKLYVVSLPDGKPIAATLLLLEKKIAIYAYSASLPDARHLRPNDLMLFRIYLELAACGYEHFDFGADSPLQHGLLRFKRKWLGIQAPIPSYFLGNADFSQTDNSSARFALVRRTIKLTPLPVARLVFPPLIRYFG